MQVAEDLGYDTSNSTGDTEECTEEESQVSSSHFLLRRKRAVTNFYTANDVTESDVQSEVGLRWYFFPRNTFVVVVVFNHFQNPLGFQSLNGSLFLSDRHFHFSMSEEKHNLIFLCSNSGQHVEYIYHGKRYVARRIRDSGAGFLE